MPAPLVLDVFSDIACPWCFIGKRRLEAALKDVPGVEVRWRAYQLQPDLPPEGIAARPFFAKKFGGEARVNQIFERVARVGESDGIAFDFLGQERAANTHLGHEAVRFAATTGHGSEAKEAMFRGQFVERADIGSIDGIVTLFRTHGVPVDLEALRSALADRTFKDGVDEDVALARSLGVSGVPFFVANLDQALGGVEGAAVAMSGAQEVAAFRSFLAEAARRGGSPAPA